ncbi:putative HTH-type transcriptional regulator YddM [compost metagenome]
MAIFNPPYPGALIAEYLEDTGISMRRLALNLGVSPAALSKLTSGKAAISPEMALRLEAGMGISARLWLAMQATYDLSKARQVVDVSHVVPPVASQPEQVH